MMINWVFYGLPILVMLLTTIFLIIIYITHFTVSFRRLKMKKENDDGRRYLKKDLKFFIYDSMMLLFLIGVMSLALELMCIVLLKGSLI